MVVLTNSRIEKNLIGISSLHFNRYLSEEEDEFYLRSANETIQLQRCNISDNTAQAILALSPYRVVHDNHDIGEYTVMLNNTNITGNGRGMEQHSWDIRDSNNQFNWVMESVK